MNDATDQELLRDYARNNSEAAFAVVVRRHIDLVYSAALRLVVDPHLAEDVTQSVFLAAAREAGRLQHISVVSSWLHATTRNQAAMTVRGEARRRRRENKAAIMNEDCSDTDAVWEQLSPQLDDALAQLRADDRDALLLRFFERKTAREIGERLGLSEDAAQKRLTRALERLREVFAGRGIRVSSAMMAGAISLQAVQTAPTALAASVVATTLSAAATASLSIPSVFNFMAATKTKSILVSLLTAGLATTVVVQRQANGKLRRELAMQRAEPTTVQEPSDPAPAPAQIEAARQEHSELLRLRGEVTLLRQQAREREAASAKEKPPETKAPEKAVSGDYISSENWSYVGVDTPNRAFQSFLAVLKAGDPAQIASMAHWDIGWKENVTDEDRALIEKSKADYLELLQGAPKKISAFNLAPVAEDAQGRTRVFFRTITTEGKPVDSSFEMIQVEGHWKPILGMRWASGEAGSFYTTPVFGPEIDLEPRP